MPFEGSIQPWEGLQGTAPIQRQAAAHPGGRQAAQASALIYLQALEHPPRAQGNQLRAVPEGQVGEVHPLGPPPREGWQGTKVPAAQELQDLLRQAVQVEAPEAGAVREVDGIGPAGKSMHAPEGPAVFQIHQVRPQPPREAQEMRAALELQDVDHQPIGEPLPLL